VRVLVAPDSFKGTLPAAGVARALAAGWLRERPGDTVVELPLADGGEGTLDAIAAAVPGAVRHGVPAVTGPDGRPVDAAWLELPGGHAVVELALSSGLPLMAAPRALHAHTYGLGEVLAAAVGAGSARKVSIAVGGSASTDGGAGALAALGARFRTAAGAELALGGAALLDLAEADLSGLLPAPSGGAEILADVTTPLLGPGGAAAVFGPQKGATPADVALLDRALSRLAEHLGGAPDAPGSGAAGGTAYGFATAWAASITPGAPRIADLVGLPAQLAAADLVITGEGHLDATSLSGKLTGYVAEAAAAANRPVIAVTGGADPAVTWPGAVALTLTDLAGSRDAALTNPAHWLSAAATQLATAHPT
jgi:glycerate 2-kinase